MVVACDFGTDGVRGLVGKGPITSAVFFQIGCAISRIYESKEVAHNKPLILVAHDGRDSFNELGGALLAGLETPHTQVQNMGLLPTPVLAYLTKKQQAVCGIMVTASHNDARYNGLKFFQASGEKWTKKNIDRLLQEIKPINLASSNQYLPSSPDKNLDFAYRIYLNHIKTAIEGLPKLQRKLKIVIDCANGAAAQLGPWVYESVGFEVLVIHNNPDGHNINHKSGSLHTATLQEYVMANNADVGIAFDGDGDRLVLVDETGELLDGDNILHILAESGLNKGHTCVVSTIMSNTALTNKLSELGVKHAKVAVGDKHVYKKLKTEGWSLGGEPSGHIIILPHNQSGDGILAGLITILCAFNHTKNLSTWRNKMPKYPRVLLNLPLFLDQESQLAFERYLPTIQKKFDGAIQIDSRRSGTEPIYRVALEAKERETLDLVQALIEKKHQTLLA